MREPEDYVRTYTDEGCPMAELLSEALEGRQRGRLNPPVPPHYLRKPFFRAASTLIGVLDGA